MKNRSVIYAAVFCVSIRLLAAEIVASKLALELFNTTCSVYKFLLTREKRMAFIADVHMNFFVGAMRAKLVATGTAYFAVNVIGMDVFFHNLTRYVQINFAC